MLIQRPPRKTETYCPIAAMNRWLPRSLEAVSLVFGLWLIGTGEAMLIPPARRRDDEPDRRGQLRFALQ